MTESRNRAEEQCQPLGNLAIRAEGPAMDGPNIPVTNHDSANQFVRREDPQRVSFDAIHQRFREIDGCPHASKHLQNYCNLKRELLVDWLFRWENERVADGTIKGLIGWEWHGSPTATCPAWRFWPKVPCCQNGTHAATIYEEPKGNVVFNARTIRWAQGLSSPPGHVLPAHKHACPDTRVQRMMKNLFRRFSR